MRRLFLTIFFLFLVAGLAFLGWYAYHSPDLAYDISEIIYSRRFHRYDSIIEQAGRRHQVDPLLIKAVIWRESRFRPDKEGSAGERGLMQVGVAAAAEWSKNERSGRPVSPNDLFDPATNIDAGTWLLARSIHHWQQKGVDDPVPFALAEYNAGHSRVQRWVSDAADRDPQRPGAQITGQDLAAKISFPGTRQYVEAVENRFRFYQQRGRM